MCSRIHQFSSVIKFGNSLEKLIQTCHPWCREPPWECIGSGRTSKVVHHGIGYQKLSMRHMARGKCMWHKPLLWGSNILMWSQEEHSRLHAYFITFYHRHACINLPHGTSLILSMDHWLNGVCYYQCHSNTLYFISDALRYISLNYPSLFFTNYLSSSTHFSSIP